MRHAHHIRPEDLMNKDLLSEAVLVGSLLGVFVIVMFILLQLLR